MKAMVSVSGRPAPASALPSDSPERYLVIVASYLDVSPYASTASFLSVSSERPAASCISRRTVSYWLGELTTATEAKFLAALRSIDGPPISMFSIASSSVTPGRVTVASKG